MRILVTGASGFVGQRLVYRLMKETPHHVYGLYRSEVNLLNGPSLTSYFKTQPRFDAVIHLAATVGGIGFNRENAVRCLDENLLMNTNLLRAMSVKMPEKFIALGSVCAYPKFTETPFKEDALWNGYPEETNAPYGLAKRMLLAQCEAYRSLGLNSIYLLPANMYGEGDHFEDDRSHVIPALIKKAVVAKRDGLPLQLWGTGTATRDFLYVDDCVDAIVRALEVDCSDPINIGTGRETSIAAVAQMIADIIGVESNFTYDDSKPDGQPRRVLDVTRAKQVLNFTAKTTLEDGLERTINWYRSRF